MHFFKNESTRSFTANILVCIDSLKVLTRIQLKERPSGRREFQNSPAKQNLKHRDVIGRRLVSLPGRIKRHPSVRHHPVLIKLLNLIRLRVFRLKQLSILAALEKPATKSANQPSKAFVPVSNQKSSIKTKIVYHFSSKKFKIKS